MVYDDRGHFTEPHTGRSFGLGTLKVRRYRQTWDGPSVTTPDGMEWGLDAIGMWPALALPARAVPRKGRV